MPDGVKKLFEPFLALPPGRRWLVGGVVLMAAAAFAILIAVANRTDYRPLFTNLSTEDAGAIVGKLKEQKVPYRIDDDGKAVLVPADKVYDLRLSLASDGLPQGGGVGFEIFDRKNFGMTEFVQKLNYQRALQGELARTISQLSGVDEARVHLAIPEKSLFKDDEKPPTASVVLKMKGNRLLRDSEVQGIVHLVSSAVEGMDPDHVTVIDSRGKIMSSADGNDGTTKLTSAMQQTQHTYEKNLEEKLQSLLDRVVGSGKSVARVSATFDFRQVEKLEEKYDPDNTAVRSEQRSDEKGGATNLAGGVPGVQSNLGKTAPGAGSATGGSKSDETLNYEVSHMTARTIEPVGTLSKLSVAILVDGKYATPAKPKGGAPKYQPLSPEELQKIDALVKSAIGFSAERGDQVTVENIPFQDTDDGTVDGVPPWWTAPIFLALVKNVLIGLAFLALIFLVIRPLLNLIRATHPTTFEPIDAAQEDLQQMIETQRAQLKQQSVNQLELIEKVKTEPYQTAEVLRNWLESKA